MKVTCPECKQEYDDTYHNTNCPHKSFEMHTGVFVNGQQGCAHTIEELTKATNENVLPNSDCVYQRTLNNIADSLKESNRLKTLSNEDLVKECIQIAETDYPVVTEMCDRLFPAWADEEGEKDERSRTRVES